MKATTALILTTVLLSVATTSFAQTNRMEVIDREEAAWKSYKEKKEDVFRKLLSSNYRGVYADNVYTLDGEMRIMSEMNIESVSLSRVDVISTDTNTVMLTYLAAIKGKRGSKDVSGNYNAASIWQKNGDQWQVILHTSIREEKTQ